VTIPAPVARLQRAVWDVVLSIVFGVLALVFGVLAVFFQFVEVAFTDYCEAHCHPGVGISGVFIIDAVVAVIVIAAVVVAIRRLVRGRRGWWVMLTAFVVVILGAVGASVVYAAAVGY
jgi:uncharacterized membrane protein